MHNIYQKSLGTLYYKTLRTIICKIWSFTLSVCNAKERNSIQYSRGTVCIFISQFMRESGNGNLITVLTYRPMFLHIHLNVISLKIRLVTHSSSKLCAFNRPGARVLVKKIYCSFCITTHDGTLKQIISLLSNVYAC